MPDVSAQSLFVVEEGVVGLFDEILTASKVSTERGDVESNVSAGNIEGIVGEEDLELRIAADDDLVSPELEAAGVSLEGLADDRWTGAADVGSGVWEDELKDSLAPSSLGAPCELSCVAGSTFTDVQDVSPSVSAAGGLGQAHPRP